MLGEHTKLAEGVMVNIYVFSVPTAISTDGLIIFIEMWKVDAVNVPLAIVRHGRGGRVNHVNGYAYVFIPHDSPFAPMIHSSYRPTGGYVFEHRLVMAQHLGRSLLSWEHIHHKNGIKDDNRLENLEIVMNGNHRGTITCPHCGKGFKIK